MAKAYQKISDLFVVDLVEGGAHQELSVVTALRYELEYVFKALTHNPGHCVCLSGSGLAVGEDRACDQSNEFPVK